MFNFFLVCKDTKNMHATQQSLPILGDLHWLHAFRFYCGRNLNPLKQLKV